MEEDFFSFADLRLEDSTRLWLEEEREDEERLDLSEEDLSEFLEWLLDLGEGDLLFGDRDRSFVEFGIFTLTTALG